MSNPDQDSCLDTDFFRHLNLGSGSEYDDVATEEDNYYEEDGEEEEEEEEEEEFSFMCVEANTSPIAAEDAFINGKIKSVFPLFNQDLLLSPEDFPMKPPVRNVFLEQGGSSVTPSAPENDGCNWSDNRTAVQVGSPETCRKSNSTGFSKIWRFKDLLGRSNSDGRDTFVFLNNAHAHAPPPAVAEKVEKKRGSKKKTVASSASMSAHEVYLRSKAKAEQRRKSYLPYKPELMGFFTNVNGGLTKNVHPF